MSAMEVGVVVVADLPVDCMEVDGILYISPQVAEYLIEE